MVLEYGKISGLLSIPRSNFPFLDLRSGLPNLATLGLTTDLHYDLGKGKVLSRNEKFAFDFSYSWTLTFQPYRTYILSKKLDDIARG